MNEAVTPVTTTNRSQAEHEAPDVLTVALRQGGWHVLNGDGSIFAVVPHEDTYGKWCAETIANLMTNRDRACTELQAAQAALKRLTRFGGAVVIDGDNIEFVAGDHAVAEHLASHGGNFVAALATLAVPA